MQQDSSPLKGIRVIDLTTYAAAPACSRVLAEWGADVIKVERPGGEVWRFFGHSLLAPVSDEENPIWEVNNAFKRSLVLDLKSAEGMSIFHRLLETADVFVSNLRPKALRGMGLDYEQLCARYPALVYGYLNGYGDKGPDADKPGFDLSAYWARGGIMSQLGEPDAPPLAALAGFGDHPSGVFLASGLVAALLGRERTGKGDKVEVALYHSAIWNMGLNITAAQYHDFGVPKFSIKCPLNPLVNPYKCKDDRWILITVLEVSRYWPILAVTLGREDLKHDERFMDTISAQTNSLALVSILEEAIAEKTCEEWAEIWERADIPFEKLQDFKDILADGQARANDFIIEVDYANGSRGLLPTTPVRLKSREGIPFKHAPLLGEHTQEILEELGIARSEIRALASRGIVVVREADRSVESAERI